MNWIRHNDSNFYDREKKKRELIKNAACVCGELDGGINC